MAKQLVLNVDDFEPQRHARTAVLRKAGFEVIEAATGRQALAMIRERQPALVVLDVHLPDIDGLEVCRRLKADAATAGVLVLHVSATFIEPGARVAALENGADGYLPEPLDPKELVAQVRSLLRLAAAESQARQASDALREALEATRRSEAEIKSIYDSAPIGLCIFDTDGRFVRINRRLAEINGPPPEAHIGRTIREVVPGIADQAEQLLRNVVDTGTPAWGVEVIGDVPRQLGVIGTWIENWHPVTDATGAVVGVNVGVADVTHLKQVEEALRQANRVKDDFLATLSHELRTPLNAILGWSQFLQRGGLDQKTTRQALDAVVRNAEAQRQLISDVLDVSRMVSGKVRLEMTEVDLAETLRLAVESMRPAAHGKGVELELSCTLPSAIVRADGDRAQQVVWNLLSNALKFTPPGGRVTAVLRRGQGGYELSVTDTGIGIRPDFLPHVFDRFAQADSSTTRPHSGLGLGLSIVRQMVELHGGSVAAASDGEGKGSTFTVTLPLPAGKTATLSSGSAGSTGGGVRSPRRLEGLRVLVVDDIEDARTLTAAILQGEGGDVSVAASGEEALAHVSSQAPDLILADLAMPKMDGYEFLRRLRASPLPGREDVPVVALTAYGSAEDRSRALDAGFAEHVTKPFLADDLFAVIARTVALRRSSA